MSRVDSVSSDSCEKDSERPRVKYFMKKKQIVRFVCKDFFFLHFQMFGLESIELPRRYDDYPRETFLEKYAKQIRIAKITILNGLFVAYFAWATFHYVHESKYALTKMLRIQS